jgi:hypothetical protein
MVAARWLDAFKAHDGAASGIRSVASHLLRQPLKRTVPLAVAALSGAYAIYALAYVTFKRMRHPYDLEWMEGGSLGHVARVLDGAPMYTAPSIDWTPFIYTPLYWYVSAGFAKLMTLDLFALRLVSLIATGVSMLAIYACVRRSGSRLAGFLAAALFAATFRLSGAWFDIARPDMLACAFGCGAIWLLGGPSPSLVRASLAGLMLAGSVLSKQTWLVAACAIAAAGVLERPRRAIALAPCFLVPLLVFWVGGHYATSGWTTYYTLTLPFQHDVHQPGLRIFFVYDVARNYGPATCLAVAAFALVPRGERRFLAIVAMGCLGAALSARVHSGAFDNVLIPGYVVLAILAGRAIAEAERGLGVPGGQHALGIVAFSAVVIQFVSLNYELKPELPNRHDRAAGKRIVDLLRANPGEVWMPHHSVFCVLANKPCHAHYMAVFDVLRGEQKEARELMLGSVREALSSGRFSALIVDGGFSGELLPIIDKHYPKRVPLEHGGGPPPKTGFGTRPTEIRTR